MLIGLNWVNTHLTQLIIGWVWVDFATPSFGLNCWKKKMVLDYCDLLIRHPIILYLFLPFWALKLMILHLFQIFFLGLCFDA